MTDALIRVDTCPHTSSPHSHPVSDPVDGTVCPARGARFYLHGPAMAGRFFRAADHELSHAAGWDLIFGDRFGRGVLNLDGEQHASYRRALMPVLRRSAMPGYAKVIAGVLDRTLRHLTVDTPVDLHAYTQTVTFEVAAKSFAGVTGDEAEEMLALYSVLRTACPSFDTAEGRQVVRDVAHAGGRLRSLLRAAVERFAEPDGPVSRLRALPDPPSTDVIAGNIAILILAGYETTSYLTARLLWLLARHPAEQQAVREEVVRQVSGDPGATPLLDASFTETSRLHPPLARLPRVALIDLGFGDTVMPAGSEVFYSVKATQRDPDLFEDPHAFRPHRFHAGGADRFVLTPFSAGRRICPGIHLGTMQARMIATAVLQAFRLTAPAGPYIDDVFLNNATVAPAAPLMVRLKEWSR
jgi:cytochrome P450